MVTRWPRIVNLTPVHNLHTYMFPVHGENLSMSSFCVLLLNLQWHALSREEQAKYYELARKERQLHMQLYPGWSARDNYVSF